MLPTVHQYLRSRNEYFCSHLADDFQTISIGYSYGEKIIVTVMAKFFEWMEVVVNVVLCGAGDTNIAP